MHLLLTAIPLDRNGSRSVLLWSLVLIGLIILAFAGYSLFKKWLNGGEETTRAIGFTLSDLRALRDQGKMSADEYEMARAKMVAAAKRMTEKMPDMPRRVPSASKFEERNSNDESNSKDEVRNSKQDIQAPRTP
jgi:hypothetical protein